MTCPRLYREPLDGEDALASLSAARGTSSTQISWLDSSRSSVPKRSRSASGDLSKEGPDVRSLGARQEGAWAGQRRRMTPPTRCGGSLPRRWASGAGLLLASPRVPNLLQLDLAARQRKGPGR